MSLIYFRKGDKWMPTRWKSMCAVKQWATRYNHVWRMDGDTLIVSEADGTINRYRQAKPARRSNESERT